LNCPLGGIITVAACSYGSTPLGLFTVLIPCITMFFSSWEQFHTGTLYLGYFNGPCEGIIIACGLMSVSAIYGPGVYHRRAAEVMGWPFLGSQVMVYELFVGMCLFAFFAVHMPSWYLPIPRTGGSKPNIPCGGIFCLGGGVNGSMWNVYQARKRKGLSFSGTLPHLIPILLFFTAHYLWLLSPYSHILENNGLMRVSLTMTFVFGRMTTKIILVLPLSPFPLPPEPQFFPQFFVAQSVADLIVGTPHETTLPILHKPHHPPFPLRSNNQSPPLNRDVRPTYRIVINH